jgi:hypothetical protein
MRSGLAKPRIKLHNYMHCFNCGSEMSLQQAVCHNCGVAAADARLRKFWIKQNAAWVISIVLCVLAGMTIFGFGAYRYLHHWQLLSARRSSKMQYRTGQVKHGDPARPDEFHAHGKLYFVPVGKQVISADSLAAYYRQKFAIEITVLPPVKIPSLAWIPERRQYIADEVTAAMTTAYPDLARMRDSVMIALTDADIYSKELGWNFTYSLHPTGLPWFPPTAWIRLSGESLTMRSTGWPAPGKCSPSMWPCCIFTFRKASIPAALCIRRSRPMEGRM